MMNQSAYNIIILVGPPGAGKSTFAADYVATHPDAVIVGRDKLREQLFGFTEATVQAYYTAENFRTREDIVTGFQHSAIAHALQAGMRVIIDDTNCNYDRLKSLVDRYSAHSVSVRFSDTPLDECLRRNERRTRKVSAETIRKYYASFLATQQKWVESKQASNELTEEGFVFIDNAGKPFCIKKWGEQAWLFYWHPDKRWVSLRTVSQPEIWIAYEMRLPDEQAAMYHQLSERNLL